MHMSVHRRTSETDERTVAVLVLGMHRSGTSSIAGTLVRLGGTAPVNLIPPGEDNERGFWESTVLAALNDEILAAGGSDWLDWRPYDVARIDAASADVLNARAKSVLASEFGDTGFPIIKDPRMCRLMRFWAPVFEEARWSVRALLPLRSPLEVAWSLERRNDVSPSNGCLMWLRHVLDAEVETRGMVRAVLDWRTFLADKRGTLARVGKQLDLDWPNQSESVYADIDDFVSADLRHHKASEAEMQAHPAINELVKETYGAVIELAEDPSNGGVLRKLDEVRARLESAVAIFDRPMGELEEGILRTRSRATAERDQFARDLAVEREIAAKLGAERDQIAGDLAAERKTAAKLAAERDQIAGDLAAERKTAAKLAAERDQIAGDLAAERKTSGKLAAERDKIAGHFAAERKDFALRLRATNAERDSLFEQIGELNHDIARAEKFMEHIASRYAEKSHASKNIEMRELWKTRFMARGVSPMRKELDAIRNSLFFDAGHYLERNPDVRASGMDPALHYLLRGGLERRDPGPFFSTEAYLVRYPDVAEAGLNALLHYETYGRSENRQAIFCRERQRLRVAK